MFLEVPLIAQLDAELLVAIEEEDGAVHIDLGLAHLFYVVEVCAGLYWGKGSLGGEGSEEVANKRIKEIRCGFKRLRSEELKGVNVRGVLSL